MALERSLVERCNAVLGPGVQGVFALLCIAAMLLYSLVFIVFPFFSGNNLLSSDMAGLYFSSWYTSNYLFPRMIGWDPYFFFGFPQNQFYPPLLPYVSSILALAMPIESALKSLLSLAILATPLSFYYFARSFGLGRGKSALSSLLMFAMLFLLSGNAVGGNFYSLFTVGLAANSFALPLFFLYFGSLERSFRSCESMAGGLLLSPGSIAVPSLLLAALVLSHSFTAFVALFAIAACLAVRPSRRAFGFVLLHLALSFLLCSFWLVPAISKLGFAEVQPIVAIQDSWVLVLAGLAAVLLSCLSWRSGNSAAPPAFFAVLSCLFILLGVAFPGLPMHFYRFTMFILLCLAVPVVSFLRRDTGVEYASLSAVAVLVILFSPPIHPEGVSITKAVPLLPEKPVGRLLIEAPPNAESGWHELQHLVPMENRVQAVRGVFVESSLNSRYIFDLEEELDTRNVNWGVAPDTRVIVGLGDNARRLVPAQLAALGITGVLAPEKYVPSWVDLTGGTGLFSVYFRGSGKASGLRKYTYSLYSTGDANLVEVLHLQPTVVSPMGWGDEVAQWFLSGRVSNSILVDENVPYVSGYDGRAWLAGSSPTMESMSVRVDSNGVVPVLIKVSYFPNWHAYSGGKELRIYRASPNFMLVYAGGDVEFRYEDTWGDMLGVFLSVVGAVVLVVVLIRGSSSRA